MAPSGEVLQVAAADGLPSTRMAFMQPLDVADSVIEIFTNFAHDGTGRSIFIHEGLLANSSGYIINIMAAAAELAAELQVFTQQDKFIVVDIPFNVMELFTRWLYAPRKDSFDHGFATMADVLYVWQWTKQYLFNTEFRDGLVNAMVKLVIALTESRGPDYAATELIRALALLNVDVDSGMARFIADWFLACNFSDAAVCNNLSAVLTVNGPPRSLCQAIIQAQIQEKMRSGAGQPQQQLLQLLTNPCKYHEHPPQQPCDSTITSLPQDHQEPAPPVREQPENDRVPVSECEHWVADSARETAKKKQSDAEVLQHITGPEEDFTKLRGHERETVRPRTRLRLLKPKGLDLKGSLVEKGGNGGKREAHSQPDKADGHSDAGSITSASPRRPGVTTRCTRASLRSR